MQIRNHRQRVCDEGHGRRGLTSRETHRWSDEDGEPGEIPTWAGSGMEKEWNADAHQCDQADAFADEESRNTLAVTRGRGEAWSTAHKRPKSEKARPRTRCCSNRGSAGPSENVVTPATESER